MNDTREDLLQKLSLLLMSSGMDPEDAKTKSFMLLEPYDVTARSTAIISLDESRNEFLIKKFIVAKTVKGCTQRTIAYYKQILKQFFEAINKTVDDITSDDIQMYLATRRMRDGLSKTSADNTLRVLRSFFACLLREDLIIRDPCLKIEKIRCPKTKKKALTDIEIEMLRNTAKDEREAFIIEFLLSTGCRASEAMQIRLDEIEGNRVLIHGKGEKDRNVYLNTKAMFTMGKYMAKRKDNSPFLFPNKYGGHLTGGRLGDLTRQMAERAGVEQANPHKFRRTCATMALQHGMPVEQVSKMLGHENLETTQIYLDLDEGELEQAHRKYVI